MTALSISLAILFSLLMLYLPFQFHSLPQRFLYPYLRMFGLAYGAAGLMIAVGLARVGLPAWVSHAGNALLCVTLAVQAYLVAYLPGAASGLVDYPSLVIALVLAELLPECELPIFQWLYGVQAVGGGVLLVARPGLFPTAAFGQLPAWLGPLLFGAGLFQAIAAILPRRFRPPTWLTLLVLALPYAWYSVHWALAGNWVGIVSYGTMAVVALGQVVLLKRPVTVRIPSLQRKVLVLAATASVLPLLVMGGFATSAAQTLEAGGAAKTLSVVVLQADREIDQLPAGSDLSPAALAQHLRHLTPPVGSTLQILPLDPEAPVSGEVELTEDFQGGTRVLTAKVARLKEGLLITASQPANLVYERAGRVGVIALVLTVLIGLLSVFGGAVASGRMTAQLAEVRDVARAIGARHFGARIHRLPQGDDEISDLMIAFNGMTETLETYSNELQRLQAVTDTALSHVSLDSLVDQLLHRVREALSGDTCVILLASHDRTCLTPAGALGLEQEMTTGVQIPWGAGFAGRIAAAAEPLLVEDLTHFDAVSPYLQARVRSVIGVPLVIEGNVIGVIHVGSFTPRHFTDDDLRLLQLAADRIALALDHARLFTEVRRLNTSLEQRVAERTAELVAANRELEAFSYSVSHDLRSPLRNIDGFSQALLEDYGEQLDSAGQDYLRRIRTSIRRMGQLIDALLQLSRVTRSQLERQRVDLSSLVRSVVSELERLAPDRQVTVDIQNGVSVTGDSRLLRIAMENLIHNAWKFTTHQAEPQISFGVTTQDGQSIYFVRDNGAGFDMAYADKLFGAFQRLHPESQYEGAGIGLATVQRIIDRHGGRIWAEGAVNQGATFYFTLERPR